MFNFVSDLAGAAGSMVNAVSSTVCDATKWSNGDLTRAGMESWLNKAAQLNGIKVNPETVRDGLAESDIEIKHAELITYISTAPVAKQAYLKGRCSTYREALDKRVAAAKSELEEIVQTKALEMVQQIADFFKDKEMTPPSTNSTRITNQVLREHLLDGEMLLSTDPYASIKLLNQLFDMLDNKPSRADEVPHLDAFIKEFLQSSQYTFDTLAQNFPFLSDLIESIKMARVPTPPSADEAKGGSDTDIPEMEAVDAAKKRRMRPRAK